MASTLDRAWVELVEFLTPVYASIESPESVRRLIGRLGHDPTAADLARLVDSLASAEATLANLTQLIGDKTDAGDELSAEDFLTIATGTAEVLRDLRGIPAAVSDLDLGPGFFSELFDLLLTEYLYFRAQPAFRILVLLGVIERESIVPGRDPGARSVPFERHVIHWNRLQRFLSSPSAVMAEVYGWGTAGFDSERLLANLAAVFDAFNVISLPKDLPPQIVSKFVEVVTDEPNPVGLELPLFQELTEEVNAEAGLLALPVRGAEPPVARDRGLAVMPYVEATVPAETPVGEDGTWTFSLKISGNVAGGTVFSVRPSGLRVDAGVLDATAAAASVQMELKKVNPAAEGPILIFGDRDGTRLEAAGISVGVGSDARDLYVASAIQGLRLVLDASGDGLLAQIIPAPMPVELGDVVAGWRPGRGIYVEQGSGLTVRIPLSINLFGVLRLREAGLRVAFDSEPTVTALVSAVASIGPLSLAFEDLGLELTITPNSDGSFGVFDLDAGIQFPSGYAVALERGPIAGGGALFRKDHEYRGVLALNFETMGFSALAILTTQLPGGRDGFSFLASVFGEFNIPLGYGFFLTGLGGIIGINRRADSSALKELITRGSLDNLLFPADPVGQAPRILDALADVFPTAEGVHVFGPVARIVFGRPTLVEGKLGVVIEVGDQPRALIHGLISSDLPNKDTALVSLRVSFFGEINLAAGTISMDAALNPGSRVLTYAISGEMAARTGWAPRIDHVISFGGLHPAYPRPANFPELSRLSINFGTNNPRVTLSAYLAVTTNSLQFGAVASLHAKGPNVFLVGQLAAEGELYLHALVYFDPFAFDAKLGGHLSLLVDGDVVLSLGLDLRLSGPNPFRVAGRVWATVWGYDVGFDVEYASGEERPLTPPTTNPVTVLHDAIVGGAGVEPIPSTTRVSGVVFPPTAVDASEAKGVVDPAAGVHVLQRAVPLGVVIERLGEAALAGGAHRYDLAVLDPAGNDLPLSPAVADFVRGHFWALGEEERLRAPAFEEHAAGFVLGGEDLVVNPDASVDAEYGYEVIVLQPRGGSILPSVVIEDVELADAVFARWSGVQRREVAQPLNPEAVAGVGESAVSIRTTEYAPIGGGPDLVRSLSKVLESAPARGRTAPANPAVAAYVVVAAAA